MDKLEEVMPPAEEKESKEQEIEKEEADGAAGKDDAEEEAAAAAVKADDVEEEEEEEAAAGKDDVVDEEKEEAAAGKDDAVDEEEEEEEAAAGKDDAADDEEEEEEEEAAGKDDAADEDVKEDKEEADGNEQGGGDKPKDKAVPQAAKKRTKKLPWQDKPKEKKPDECLNLNNEVVRMRKEVKRVRGLVIRKLTRQMAALKKRKGKELAVESNQRRAGRLLEEIHAMKTLPTDLVSKTALQRNLNFDQVCKNPRSTISDRALARIATHPQFNKKIQDIKAAVKAFKEERIKGVKQGGKEKVQIKGVKVNLQSPEKNVEREKEERGVTVEQKEDKEEGDDLLKDITVAEPEKEPGKASPAVSQRKEMPEASNVRLASVKGSEVKDVVKDKPQAKQAGKKPDPKSLPQVLQKKRDEEEESDLESDDGEEDEPQAKNQPDLKSEPPVLQKKMDEEEESDLESDDGEEDEPQSEKKPDVKSAPKVLQKKRDEEEESDLESDGVEKEYFDDSTEERFHKKSSQSEESDDDGFFVGKVRKFSKKKKKKNSAEEDTASEWRQGTSSDKVQGELDELESRLKSKATSFQSVFCSSLSSSRPGGGRGRGGDGFRGRGRPNDGGGRDRDFSKPKFQKQEREPFSSGGRGRGRGRGRGDGMRQNDRRAGGGSAFTQHAPEQALHPSWEASKKRKEQQGQILAFQGKKIKFDIDD